jgi:hypothetical protein
VPEWSEYAAFCEEYERGLRREAFIILEFKRWWTDGLIYFEPVSRCANNYLLSSESELM